MRRNTETPNNPEQRCFDFREAVICEPGSSDPDEQPTSEGEEWIGGSNSAVRDDAWLTERVRLLWENHFADAPRGYPIVTRFGIRARYRFGSIAARKGQTIILVNRLFAHEFVPAYVVDATLGHELAHYVHGFGSGLPKLYADAHRGGVVDQELERRGLGTVGLRADQWREQHWSAFYERQCADLVAQRAARGNDAQSLWRALLERGDVRTEGDLRARLTPIQRQLQPYSAGKTPILTV